MADDFDMIAKTFFGLEGVLADELASLGAKEVSTGRRMCSFRGDRALLYRANIRCRTAVRVLKPVHAFTITDEASLYRGVGELDWLAHLEDDGSLAIDPVVHHSIFENTLYTAQLAKDAIVDQIRAKTGRRPSIDLADPDLRINLHIDRDRVTLYLDASGDSLHKRGYRAAAGEAPLNEVLAAGVLRLSGWDGASPLSDFMCGSGTLLIEAAMMARGIAPGTLGRRFGYTRWKDFCPATHDAEMASARAQARPALFFPIQGTDLDPEVLAAARENARRATVDGDIAWSVANFEDASPPAASGMLVTNPPYDRRMKTARIEAVYRRIGDALKQHWADHTAFLLIGNPDAAKHVGLRPSSKIRLFNGPIECRLLKFDLFAAQGDRSARQREASCESLPDFSNRLRRMARHWRRWFSRQNVDCFRVYDRDVPGVPLAIDWYAGHVLISPYERPHGRTQIEQTAWLEQIVGLAAEGLDVPRSKVLLRAGDAGAAGGGPRAEGTRMLTVHEGPLAFDVRLDPSKETGLAIDRRDLRKLLYDDAPECRALDLFARAGTATVAMALGGATSTKSVEASTGWTAWAKRNWKLNDMSSAVHRIVCQDPLEFVAQLDPAEGPQFDLALVEPPGFDGQRRAGVWNVQDGHVELLNQLLACMAPHGRIYFVTTFRRFKLDAPQLCCASVREITRRTIPRDIRDKKAHRSWLIFRDDQQADETKEQG
jgi:23S rRNA (guanine2445-N2)-methyltransferase / 23S rRNA (guanine2069-N7)-methyltransferase